GAHLGWQLQDLGIHFAQVHDGGATARNHRVLEHLGGRAGGCQGEDERKGETQTHGATPESRVLRIHKNPGPSARGPGQPVVELGVERQFDWSSWRKFTSHIVLPPRQVFSVVVNPSNGSANMTLR